MPTLGFLKRKKKDKTTSRWKIEAPWESSSKKSGNDNNGNGNADEASASLTTSLTTESLKQSIASASSVSSVPSVSSTPTPGKQATTATATATVHPEQKALAGTTMANNTSNQTPYQSNINDIINPPDGDDQKNVGNNTTPAREPAHESTRSQPQGEAVQHNGNAGYTQPQSNGIAGTVAVSETQVAQLQNAAQTQVRTESRSTGGRYALSDFVIQRTLGTGSFGRVHLVQSRHNLRFYAIKVLKKAQVVRMKQVEHTNDERRMLQKVRHPFLVTLWGTFQDCRNLYMVMDFIEGGELFSLLRKSQRFPNPVAKFYAAEVALALDYLHGEGIIYRDLKPENLLLDRHGHLKITDFGFAKEVPDITWTLCGTPDYLAPEVVTMKGYNKSVDWWSLGILIFEMLCGYTPFYDAGSPMRIYENIKKGTVKYPHYINADALDLLQQLITPDLTKRLGNLRAGSNDIKHHKWFAEVNWDRLVRREIEAPYIPPVKGGVGDASQFDRYPEEQEQYGIDDGNDPYGHLFENF